MLIEKMNFLKSIVIYLYVIIVIAFIVLAVTQHVFSDSSKEEENQELSTTTEDDVYDFVICYHEPTGTNNTYPEGTECGNSKNSLNEPRINAKDED